jgi:hypothetical protein
MGPYLLPTIKSKKKNGKEIFARPPFRFVLHRTYLDKGNYFVAEEVLPYII